MWQYLFFVLMVVALSGVTSADNSTCGGNLTNETGTFATPANLTKGENCTWYIETNQTSPQVMLLFNVLSVPAKGDNLTIYAGNSTSSSIITNFYNQQGSQMVISLSNITKIVLVRSQNDDMTIQFNLTYNTRKCSQTVVGNRGVVTSPIYLNGTGKFTCTYNVSMPTNRDVVVLSFSEAMLPNASVLVSVNNKVTTNITGTSLPDDVVGSADTKSVTLTLSVTNSSLPQKFTAVYQTYDQGCSGTFTTNDTGYTNLSQPSLNQFPVSCYARLVSSDNTSQLYILNPYYGELGVGADSVLFLDGGSRRGNVLGSGNTKLSWFVSSSNTVTVVGNYAPSDGARDPVRFRADSVSKYFTIVNKTQVLKIDVKTDASFQFQTTPSTQLLFSLNPTTKLLAGEVVSLYDDQNNLLYKFGDQSAVVAIPTPGPRLLVTVSGMSEKQSVSMSVQQKTTDCNQLLQASSGQFSLVSRANQSMCNSVISSGDSIILKLDGLNTLSLCNMTTLEVYQGYNSSTPLVTFSGNFTSAPPTKFPMGYPPRLVVKAPQKNNCSAVYVHAVFWKDNSHCGWQNQTSGVITSPAYPNQYPVYSTCNLTLPYQNNSMVFVSVKDILLSPRDNVTVQTRESKVLAKFNGTALPPDVILPNSNLSAVFSTDMPVNWMNPGQGFSLSYKILTCGGLQNESGTNISSPSNLTAPVECVWIIQVPMNGTKKSVNILSLNITVNGSITAGGSLNIYDGASIRDPMIPLNLTNKTLPTILSRTNVIIIQYVYTLPKVKGPSLKADSPFTFKLNYTTYNCNSSSLCDSGLCLHPDWRCNGKDDCGDGTDERNCNGTKPIPPSPPPPAPQCDGKKTGVAPYVVVVMLFLGLVLGVLIVVLTPKIIRKIRARSYSSNSNYGSLHEDT